MSIANLNSTTFRFSMKSKCRGNTDSWLFLFLFPSVIDFPDYSLVSKRAKTQTDRINKRLISKKTKLNP